MSSPTHFWRNFPRSSVVIFLLGVFFIFSLIGFANDVAGMGRQPTLRFVLNVLQFGVFAILYAYAGFALRGKWWMGVLPIFVLQQATMNLLQWRIPDTPIVAQMGAAEITALNCRLAFDGVAITVGVFLGYACFVYVSITEGRRYFHVHAEMALAAEIHHVLVPDIDMRIDEFEFHGRSVASGDVGGDLIDVFQGESGWTAYVADVSGHGVAPGVVMAMVKSAARMELSSGQKVAELLGRLNSVLYPIKKPDMFATFAYLAWNGARLEYSLAGHPSILHYHSATKEVSEEAAYSNMPLGMFDGQEFVSGTLECGADDVFLMLTDGLLEVANSKQEEFGLAGVKAVLAVQGGNSLAEISQAIRDAAKRFGHAADDQSLLLVRRHNPSTKNSSHS
ncbi:MAG: PP2C family protein-serine/threonine phosphatase [Candidatus Acidiferrales bacterium]